MPKRALDDEPEGQPHQKIRRLGDEPRSSGVQASVGNSAFGARDLAASLDERQLDELLETPKLSPAPSLYSAASSGVSDEHIPHAAPRNANGSDPPRPAGSARAEREAARRSRLMMDLRALPQDVQHEYVGPHFDFDRNEALEPYETGLGIDYFSRISCHEYDIPNSVIELHPHLFVSLEKFKAMATCLAAARNDAVFADNLWKRFALVEAPPYQSGNATRGLCKQQQAEMDAELSMVGLLDLSKRSEIASRYEASKRVDARTYTTLKVLNRLRYGISDKRKASADQLVYLGSAMPLEQQQTRQLINYNDQCSKTAPCLLARKGRHTFISGEMVKVSCELLKANVRELHDEAHIQLMAHFPTGAPTGEYKSLFTHAKGNFSSPTKAQAEQLGLPPDHVFKKEAAFEAIYQHRDDFYGSIKPVDGIDAKLEEDNSYMYRRMDFDALLNSDYHKLRLAVSLVEDDAPFDLDRCERIKALLDLDDRLRYKDPAQERQRDRESSRV